MMNWDDLRIFLAVARARSLAAAARSLTVDVTTVGRRLARLEDAVGGALFETIGGERHLTGAGQALLAQTEAIEAVVLATESGPATSAIAGHVRLSLAEGLATHVVGPAVARFGQAHPLVWLDLITASGFLNPSKREADIAVMLARPRNHNLLASKLTDYSLSLYATAAYLAASGEPQDAVDLRNHSLIGYVPEFIHAIELDYLSEIHSGLKSRFTSTSINVQHAMIRSACGIGILPDFIGDADPTLIRLLPHTFLVRTFWLVTHKDAHASPRIQAVSDWLRAEMDARQLLRSPPVGLPS